MMGGSSSSVLVGGAGIQLVQEGYHFRMNNLVCYIHRYLGCSAGSRIHLTLLCGLETGEGTASKR